MFEVVHETRKDGQTPDAQAAPLTSLVLSSKFPTEAKARSACQGFQAPYDERWDEEGRNWFFGRSAKEPGKVSIWYYRPEA